MFLIDKRLAHVLVGNIQIDANHQTVSAHLFNMWAVDGLQLFHQVVTHLMGILHQVLLFKDIEHSQCCSTCQMIAAKCCTQLSVNGLEVGANQYATHRESVGNTLGNGDDIGLDTQPLMGKELTRTSVAALYLVAYQRSAITLAGVSQILGKLRCGHLDTANTLYALQNDSTDTTA